MYGLCSPVFEFVESATADTQNCLKTAIKSCEGTARTQSDCTGSTIAHLLLNKRCVHVCTLLCMFMLPAPLWQSDNQQLPPIQANAHSFIHTGVFQTLCSAPMKCFPSNPHTDSPKARCCYRCLVFGFGNRAAIICTDWYQGSYQAVMNGCLG